MSYGKDVQAQLREPARALRRAIPDVMAGFAQLHEAALRPGELDTRTKELIALAIAVSKRCDGCIAAHARGSVRAGASEAQIAEAIGVAVLMDGGPATVYGPRAFAAAQEYLADRATDPAAKQSSV